MLTYFLEGENASTRQRRISHSTFSHSNCTMSSDKDIFGQPIIHSRRRPNGQIPSPTEELKKPSFQNCDIRDHVNDKRVCDTGKTIGELFHTNFKESPIIGAAYSTPYQMSYSDQIIHMSSTQNPFADKNNTKSSIERQHSVNVPLLSCNGGTGYPSEEKTSENIVNLKRLELTRNMSLPSYSVAEDAV